MFTRIVEGISNWLIWKNLDDCRPWEWFCDQRITSSHFQVGTVLVASDALHRLYPRDIMESLNRHAVADWGTVTARTVARNDRAMDREGQVISRHRGRQGIWFLIVTDPRRKATLVLL